MQVGRENLRGQDLSRSPHGFNANYRPSYRADIAKDGWTKMLAWFREHGVA